MGLMRLKMFTQIIHSWIDTNNAGRREIRNNFKKGSVLDLMIFNFKNAVSHRYVVQKS